MNEWPHLGHIVSAAGNDSADVINRRTILCGQINNVLCYFGKCQSVIRQNCCLHIATAFMAMFFGI